MDVFDVNSSVRNVSATITDPTSPNALPLPRTAACLMIEPGCYRIGHQQLCCGIQATLDVSEQRPDFHHSWVHLFSFSVLLYQALFKFLA